MLSALISIDRETTIVVVIEVLNVEKVIKKRIYGQHRHNYKKKLSKEISSDKTIAIKKLE